MQNFFKDQFAVRLYKFVEMAMILVATARTSIIAATIFSLEVDTPCTFLPFQNQKTTFSRNLKLLIKIKKVGE